MKSIVQIAFKCMVISSKKTMDHFVDVNNMINNGRGARDIYRDILSQMIRRAES